MEEKGIFCIEGLWDNDLRNKMTVQPILELLERTSKIPYIHRDCATVEEFEYFIKKWKIKRYSNYPILYLAFHGKENSICIGSNDYSLDDLAEQLNSKCKNSIIVISSCSTCSIDKRHLKRFLNNTKALGICGYKVEVDWMKSAAFELLLLSTLQENSFSGQGIKSIYKKINKISKMFPELKFRMVTSYN